MKPTGTHPFTRTSGGVLRVPLLRTIFPRWSTRNTEGDPITQDGKPIPTYGGKEILNWEGEPVYAEIFILRMLQQEGWQGVWVDSFRHKFLISIWPDSLTQLDPPQRAVLEKIADKKSFPSGCWDVFAWRGKRVLFAEAKRLKKDHIQPSQVRWLENALHAAIPVKSFLLVEWD